MKWLRRIGWTLGGLVLALLLALLWLLLTSSGLHMALALSARLVPGELQWEHAEGRLAGPLEIRELRFSGAAGDYRLQRLEFDWSPTALADTTLWVERLHLQGLRLAPAAPGEAEPVPQTQSAVPDIRLPLRIVLRDVRLDDIEFLSPDGATQRIERLQLAADAGGRTLKLQRLELASTAATARASGRIALAPGATSRLDFDWEAALPELPVYAGAGELRGNLETLTLVHRLQQPAAAELSLQLEQPLEALRWSLQLSLPETALARFAPGLPPHALGLTLQADGDLAAARIQATLNSDHPQLQGEPLTLQARVSQDDWNRFRLEATELQLAESRLQLTGEWTAEAASGRLELAWPDLHWPPGAPQFSAADGRLVWAGAVEAFELELHTALAGPALPQTRLELRGDGDAGGFSLQRLRAELLDGVVAASGRVGWARELAWELDLSAQDIDPGTHWADWPGQLAATLETRGRVEAEAVTASVRLQRLDGRLRGLPIAGGGDFQFAPTGLRFVDLVLRTGENRLSLNGGPTQSEGLRWELDFPELADTLPGVHGSLQGQGRLQGDWPQSRVNGELQLQALDWADLAIEQAGLVLDAAPGSPQAPLVLTLKGSDWQWQTDALASVSADLTGSLSDHRLQLDAEGPSHALRLALSGSWREPDWSGRIDRFDWTLPQAGTWTLDAPVELAAGQDAARLAPACWQQDAAELCLQGDAAQAYADWQASGQLSALPLSRLQPWLPEQVAFDSALSVRFSAQRSGEGLRSEGSVSLPAGTVTWGQGEDAQQLPHGEGELEWQLNGGGLQAHARLGLLQEDRLTAELTLPGFRPGASLESQTVIGSLQGEIRRLEVIELFVPAVTRAQGELNIDSRISGRLGAPEVQLGARLTDAALWVPVAGIRVQDIGLELASAADGQLQLQGGASSGDGRIEVDGRLDLRQLPDWRLQLALQGEDFLVLDVPEARLPVSPDLALKVQPPRLDLTGRVHVPEARLAPRDFSGAVGPSRDVVVVTESAEQAPRWQVHARVTLSLGEAVRFEGYGLTGRLAGQLELIDEPGQLTRARGELQVVDGNYAAYGQALEISQGRVIYSGGPVDNPALDATAVRKVDDITAGLRLGGYLQDPELELFSRPAMAEGDVLSYLMLGRPLSGTSGAEGQLLLRAASALGVKGGNALAGEIGGSLGLDEVSVSGGETAQDASLVLGKYLSPRLYVNYSVGLFESLSTLNLRYELSRRWTLESELGVESGVDLMFNIER